MATRRSIKTQRSNQAPVVIVTPTPWAHATSMSPRHACLPRAGQEVSADEWSGWMCKCEECGYLRGGCGDSLTPDLSLWTRGMDICTCIQEFVLTNYHRVYRMSYQYPTRGRRSASSVANDASAISQAHTRRTRLVISVKLTA